MLKQPQGAADHPHSGILIATKLSSFAVTPIGQHVDCSVVVLCSTAQKGLVDRHRYSGTDKCQRSCAFRVASSKGKRHQRPHAVADQGSFFDFRRIHCSDDFIRHVFDSIRRRSFGTTMAGQVSRQHVVLMPGKKTRGEDPDSVIHPGPVYKDDRFLFRLMVPSTCIGENIFLVSIDIHGRSDSGAQVFCAAPKAVSRSCSRSCGSSSPTDRRISPSEMPAA